MPLLPASLILLVCPGRSRNKSTTRLEDLLLHQIVKWAATKKGLWSLDVNQIGILEWRPTSLAVRIEACLEQKNVIVVF